ncbi:hypothetical protein NA57DRAFT_40782 [Rhizodiscina lignyota]|uniref:Uncharacterized protein n=1 Tax=Rhizodiscina lignyota TaxID=1504668 RepID=A0A9P4IF18_9PEZI|nr:hypothetical protein NA57DRAFT_40782 [Rhizodiscina lignyota]
MNRRLHNHLSFTANTRLRITSGPISLLARIDDEEYIALSNVSHLVPIRVNDLSRSDWHSIRIIAPMTDGTGSEMVQLEGLWIEKGARLGYVDGGLSRLWNLHLLHGHAATHPSAGVAKHEDVDNTPSVRRRKLIEFITDMPGSRSAVGLRGSKGPRGLLAGVMGWDYLLGEMFGIDHISVGTEGMCLVQGYVIIMNLGSSDGDSFARYPDVYNKTRLELMSDFEETYISLIKAIRNLAYPSVVDGDGISDTDEDDEPFGGPLIPIFVMRPFGGEMEHSTLEVVRRLRKDGDKNVFWIDTSGWLDVPNLADPSDISAYLLSQFKLTPRANQKVAIYLHMHVCRYLAARPDKCPFLKSQTYEGRVYEPAMERLERWVQGEIEGKVKAVLMEKERPKVDKGEEKGLAGL